MALIRYLLYFAVVALLGWAVARTGTAAPDALALYRPAFPGDPGGTSEFSPVELVQPLMLLVCGLLCGWVARDHPSQRPVAFALGGVALILLIGECEYVLDRYVAANLGRTLEIIAASLLLVYTFRHRRRFRIAWLRLWPSPGLTLLFAGAVLQFAWVPFVGQEALWTALLDDAYRPVAQRAFDELVELLGYCLWLAGTIEYVFQVRAMATRDPQPAAVRRRGGRRQKSVSGRY